MAMPGGIETRRQYSSMGSFRQDEREMVRKGWTMEGFTARGVRNGLVRRILHRHSAEKVDAHYLRRDWPVEG
jgi:hypothetical protein